MSFGEGMAFRNSHQKLTVTEVFQTFYERLLLPKQKPSGIAWIGSTQACVVIGVGIIAGPLSHHGSLQVRSYRK